MVAPVAWLILGTPVFPCSQPSQNISALPVSLWGETEMGPYVVPQKAGEGLGKLLALPCFPIPSKGYSLYLRSSVLVLSCASRTIR